jgi:hypothetical protein
MDNERRFYTYAYLREDRTPYYIGKGKGRRAFRKEKTIPRPPEDRILFLKTGLTEKEAFRHECYMIAVFGRKNNGTGILRNLTDGGEGHSGHIPTEETRKKIGDAHRGRKRPPEVCEKIRRAKLGHPTSEETRRKISEGKKGKGCIPCSEEKKKKISEANKGHNRPWSELRWERHRQKQAQKRAEGG